MRVFVVTPPAQVVSLEEAKAHLRVDADDEDAQIAGFVAAATAHIDGPDGWLGRAIGPQVLEARRGLPSYGAIHLPYRPMIELVSISYLDASNVEQMADLDDVEVVGSDLMASGASWPWVTGSTRREALRIRYRAGYEALPAAIRAAILLMTEDLYRNRGEAVIGTIAAQVQMAPTVTALLTPFRVYS